MVSETEYFNTILNDVKSGNISNIEGLVANSDEEIFNSIGPGAYDELFNAALDSGNTDMVRLLLRRSNLIQAPLEGIVDSLTGRNVEEIKTELNKFIRSVNRSNLQTNKSKNTEWNHELEKAKSNGYKDLAERLENRINFENNRRQNKEIAGEDRWYLDEKAWFMDGFGRMEYDLYGQNNGSAIVEELRAKGIRADLSAYIKNEKTGDLNDYRIYVNEEDVRKLHEFLDQKRQEKQVLEDVIDISDRSTEIKNKESHPIEQQTEFDEIKGDN